MPPLHAEVDGTEFELNAAAIANAVFAPLGVRDLPIAPDSGIAAADCFPC